MAVADDLAILAAAEALIRDPAYWCQGAYSKATGEPGREQYCAVGAIQHARREMRAGPPPWSLGTLLDREAAALLRERGIRVDALCSSAMVVNDDLGHGAVLELYRRARAALERELREVPVG